MRHGKRGSKLLSLALSILLARSFVALVETPRMARTNRHKSPSRATRTAFDLASMAQFEPLVTVTGRTLKDVRRGTLDANNNLRFISKQTALVDIFETQAHTERLAQTLVKSLRRPWWRALCTSEKALNIFLLNVTLPLIPVNGTEFQHLVSNVLSDATSTGVSSIHAEPGVGKSVAVALAVLGWAKANPKSITVLVRGRLNLLNDFFRVRDQAYIPAVAASLFPMLSDAGVRLQLVLDDIFDKANGEDWQLLIMLANAAHMYGQVIVVTQSERAAMEVAFLNGARTRLARQQESVSKYRWNEMQAFQLLLHLNATEKVRTSMPKDITESKIQNAVRNTFADFRKALDKGSMASLWGHGSKGGVRVGGLS